MKRTALLARPIAHPIDPARDEIFVELRHDEQVFLLDGDETSDVRVPGMTGPVLIALQQDGWRAKTGSDIPGAEPDDPVGGRALSAERDVDVNGARLRLTTFDAAPLDDVIVLAPTSDWVLFGRRHPVTLGRWPAVRVVARPEGDAQVQRAIAIVHIRVPREMPLQPPLDVVRCVVPASLPEARTQDIIVELFEAFDGITVRDLVRALEAGVVEPTLAQRIFAPVAARARQVGTLMDDIVLTFDGDVRLIERQRGAQHGMWGWEDTVERAVGPYLRYGDISERALTRDDIANIVRGIAVDAWREEQLLREQFATLSVDEARRFFADAAERTRSPHTEARWLGPR